MKKLLVILLSLMMLFGIFAATASAAGISFTDVKPGDWFYDDVKNAVGMGLVNGKSATIYAPDDNMTYAEATKLAACMHEKYTTGKVTQGNSPTGNWYDSYVEYAKANGIISGNYNWNAPATRAGYMSIFAHALPDSAFTEINNIPDDTIPDVKISDYYGKDIYKLYRAGVLEGSTDYYNGKKTDHLCKPADSIKRSEVAAILTRMMDPAARKTFSTVPGTALTIATQPKDVAIIMGSNATFSVAASGGTPPYAYEWHRVIKAQNNYDLKIVQDEPLITGTKTDTLTTKQCLADENGDQYYCVVTDAANNKVTSNKATLTINAINLTVQMQKTSVTATEGGKAYFTVGVSGGYEPYSFEWHRIIKSGPFAGDDYALDDNDVFPGASTANLTVTNCAIGENGDKYYCVVTDSKGNKGTSDKATLTVNSAALTITTQPKSTTSNVGDTVYMSVKVSGGKTPYTYQWYKISPGDSESDAFALSNGGAYSGVDTDYLTARNTTVGADDGCKYFCVITDANNKTVKSNKATVTVKLTATASPTSKTVNADQAATFTVSVSGGKAPYTYLWRTPNSFPYEGYFYEGVTSKSFKVLHPDASYDGKQFYCVVTDANGKTVESNIVTLYVN